MGVFGGPNVSEDGLVLALDAGNRKSYSQNVFPYPLDGYSWGTSGHQMTVSRDTSTSSPVGNSPLKLVTSGTGAYTNTYNSLSNTLSPAAQGQTWTFSFWVKGSSSFSASMLIFESNSSGNYIAYGQPYYSVTTEWTRVSGSYTMTQATTTGVQVRIDCYVNGVTLWVDGFQVERSSSMSTFTSVYTGDICNNLISSSNNGTLTNGVSYNDSNGGSLVFDGTNDYITTGYNPGIVTKLTVSVWLKVGTYANDGAGIAIGTNSLGTGQCYLGRGTSGGNSIDWRFYTGSYLDETEFFTNSTDWQHITGTYDQDTGQGRMRLYSNGNLVDTALSNDTSGINFSTGSNIRIGTNTGDNSFFGGNIAQVSIYNRALSAAEISQNFNALRGRYGI